MNNNVNSDMYYNQYGYQPKPFIPRKKSNLGLVIALIVSAVFVLGVVILIALIMYVENHNPVVGTYYCKGISSKGDYSLELRLNKDKTFEYGAYNDLKDNHYSGKYEYSRLKKEHNNGAKYYKLDFNYEEFVLNGSKEKRNNKTTGEIGIIDEDDIVLMFNSTYNIYSCIIKK